MISPEDHLARIHVKFDEYFAFGIPCAWLLFPGNRVAWIHTPGAARRVATLTNLAGDLRLPLAALFGEQ